MFPGEAGTRTHSKSGGEEGGSDFYAVHYNSDFGEYGKTSESMCAVVKGYPFVIRNSDNPEKRWGVPFDTPLFHWYGKVDRDRQLIEYMKETFHISAMIR